jgi:hypothetical protein
LVLVLVLLARLPQQHLKMQGKRLRFYVILKFNHSADGEKKLNMV